MKKLCLIISLFFLLANSSYANINDILVVDIQYDWINKSELEKESIITEIRDIIFDNGPLTKYVDFKNMFKDRLKDKNYKEHYMIASAGRKETEEYKVSAFYYKKQKHIYMYALQPKESPDKTFYYDALGNLRYVDFHYGEPFDFPFYTIKYSISGKPISAIYNVSKDNQYLYEPDGSFKGVWYKHNLYDGRSKIILTRTTY